MQHLEFQIETIIERNDYLQVNCSKTTDGGGDVMRGGGWVWRGDHKKPEGMGTNRIDPEVRAKRKLARARPYGAGYEKTLF